MPIYQMRILYEAALALAELGLATKPQLEQENGQRRQRAALLRLPADLSLRLALNRNHLRPIAEKWEEEQADARKKWKLDPEEAPKEPAERQTWFAARLDRIKKHDAEMEKAARVEVEWSPAAVIHAKTLGDREGFSDEWLSRLLAIGVIVMDDGKPESPPKDAKKKRTRIEQTVEVERE
jgi:hypothetical protein